ncbi:biotin synthase [Pelosinus fermentans]|jgi:biotin synthase|uniref:biotin synthase BioB n=1 Tax=Pelosinus fermentans TaxID=365349 RepID=UPI0002684578|nr:biotin synthase BioB [Pelosinus fermentans]OAM96218.1 Biotin synthase [Pelosinus fermentans DSM 17108]SDR37668.1 biotin synthase [Pelosinus fermentans]
MHYHEIIALGESILQGHQIQYKEALQLTHIMNEDIPLLSAFANKIRLQFTGRNVDMCGIVNARSGMCSEDCKFCAQSVYHDTQTPIHNLLDIGQITAAAQKAQEQGAKRISIVTSGKGMDRDPDFQKIIESIQAIMNHTSLKVCANLGTLSLEQARMLASAGVKRYAHNLETSENFYPSVCTTHSYQERVDTIQAAKAAGMELCTGGIIGMGESWQDRIDFAFAIKSLDVASIPINILNPIKGTALEDVMPPSPLDIIKTFAIFRFICPDKIIRPAGGREINLRDMQGHLMLSGANGLIIGNYLTFTGRNTVADFQMVQDAGLIPALL